ncbi:hypothetical protein FQN54_002677 [Arachnomyces sp. PD_36]|nr:hypothetical protein FQN54_002677 [Arachnomyces sp. PD_36]
MNSQKEMNDISHARNLAFLLFPPTTGRKQPGNSGITVVRERDFENFSAFQKAVENEMHISTTETRNLILITSSDTLNEARKFVCDGDFMSNMNLDLRAPEMQSYHSGFSGAGVNRTLDIRFSAGNADIRPWQRSKPVTQSQRQSFERRPNLVYYRYELGNKRSICLFSERGLKGTPTPARDRATVESIWKLEETSSTQTFPLHPFWILLTLLYHVIDTRKTRPQETFTKLLAIESHLLDGSLVKMESIGEFGQHIQDLHEILRTFTTFEHSNELDLSLMDDILVDIELLSREACSLGEEYALAPTSEARLKNAFLCLRRLCKERDRKFRNRKQRTQNLVQLLYQLTGNRDSLNSLELARRNADIARDTKKKSESMNTIAILTMLYLPATLVCSFFGTNFFALTTEDDGYRAFIVSELCWICFLSTVLLTGFTISIWLRWKKRIDEN